MRKYKPVIYKSKKCLKCEKEFIPKWSNHHYCGSVTDKNTCAYQHHKEVYLKAHRGWQIKYFAKYPWVKHLRLAQRRCRGSYKKRGIKCFLTKEEIKGLWFRDKAYELNKPSIDRIIGNDHYCFSNCRFIEFEENIKVRSYKCPKCGEIFAI